MVAEPLGSKKGAPMKIIISFITALCMLIAGIFAFITGVRDDDGTPPPETEAPPVAASVGRTFTPPAMPPGPYDTESLVISYNLSEVLEMPATNVWGGQMTRIARLGDDLYVLFGTHVFGVDDEEYTLYRYSGAQDEWTQFYGLRSIDVPGLHIVDGRVYVAYRYTRGLGILEYDPATDEIILRDSGIFWPAQHEKDHWAYMSTGISGDRHIWFLGCGNIDGGHARPGGFAIYSYDTVTGAFDTGSRPRWIVDFRHCYNYILDNGDGGITIAGNRDIFWDVCEWNQPAGVFDAIFDEINFWTYKNNTLSDIHRVDKVSQGRNCPVPTASIHNGDAYVDVRGFLHLVYTVTGEETGGRQELWHAVYKDGVELKKEFVHLASQSSRFIEDTSGQLYLIVMPYGTRTVRLYKVNEQHEITLSKELVIESDDSNALPSVLGLAITAPRSGSAPADFVDVIYPNMPPDWGWVYFRLQLR